MSRDWEETDTERTSVDHQRLDRYRRQESPLQEHAIDEFVEGHLSRREFVRKATTVGIAIPSIAGILAASGYASSNVKTSGATSASGGKAGATIRAGQIIPVEPINPLLGAQVGNTETSMLAGEYLTLVDQHNIVRPWLAESWKPNKDGTAWTFKIRKGVKFNNGRPMTADDVVYTFKMITNPKLAPGATFTYGGIITPDGVEKVDNRHVRFNLEAPFGAWPSYGVSETAYISLIVPNHYDYTKYEKQFPGTGPFKMVRYSRGIGGTFVRNPHYWGRPALPARIEVTYYADEAALTSALLAGDVDVNDRFTVSSSPQLLNGQFKVVSFQSSAHRQASMRSDTGPFANKLVRQALALTLNRPEIVQALFKGHGHVGNDSPFAPVFPSTNKSVPQRVQDIAKAKQLLTQAGVPNGFKATLATEQFAEVPQYAQIIKNSAAQIGIDITLSILSQAVFYGGATTPYALNLNNDMSIIDWSPRGVPNQYLTSPLQTTDAKTGAGSFNAPHFSNPRYDALSKQFIAAVDLSTQRKLAGQIESLLLDQTPAIYAYFLDSLTAMRKNVSGVYPLAFGILYGNMTKS